MVTKRFLIALLSIFLSVLAFATNKDMEKDITMVSYEQGWMDRSATLALKNNSSEEIKNVVFLITYLDMSNNELDYEEFTKRVSIAPGMTKKLDIPAYEHDRSYHYYKSENRLGGSPAFKVKFQLKDYNIEEEATESIDDNLFSTYDYERSSGDEGLYLLISHIVGILFFISITIGLYVLVAVMAQKRNRSVVVWILLSLLATPLLMIIILLAIGKDEN